jgi:ribokinase
MAMITVFGSVNLDLVGAVSRIPVPGETVPGGAFATAPGGKGANQALAARRSGAAVRLVAAVGEDGFAEEALALLRAEGVDLAFLRRVPGRTGVAMIFVDPSGENVIAVLPGANAALSPADAEAGLVGLARGDVLVLQQEVPQAATAAALDMARRAGVVSILNTAPFLPDTAGLAPRAAILVANETEFAHLAGPGDLDAAMAGWVRRHGQTVIVTLGGAGARAASPEGGFAVPALRVEPVDTVGAGDTFVGYLAAGLAQGLALRPAMQRAAAAASLACLRAGAQPAIPYAGEVEAALRSGSI